jgi:Ca-activated chloride channel family protein
MLKATHVALAATGVLAAAIVAPWSVSIARATGQDDPFRFRSGVELINVTATVSDSSGRFVSGLRQEDFIVYEDGVRQTITHFSAERVPVSLGLVVDTSGSMVGEKIEAARSALHRFFDLLDGEDEVFLYRFSDDVVLLQDWTSDRQALARALRRLTPNGATAMYDAVADAVPLAETGRHRKKAVVIISDGNDTSSRARVGALKQLIRESEVLVYAIGLDGDGQPTIQRFPPAQPRFPIPAPFPRPGRPGGGGRLPGLPPGVLPQGQAPLGAQGGRWAGGTPREDRVNVMALRDLTDDSGGRTEIIREPDDLGPATAGIADELSQQYYLGYPAGGNKDGKWHSIRVEVREREYVVRARRGYVGS